MTKTSFYLSAIIIFAMSAFNLSCGSKTEESETDSSEEFAAAEEEIKNQIKAVMYDIPSPSEIPGLLERTGVDFNGELLHNHEDADKYITGNDKTCLNLGVYATDIGYLISYEKVQDALNYMSNAKKLADELGLSGTFETEMLEKFEANLGNKDSLTIILDKAINNSNEFLKNEDRTRLAALLMTGSLSEGMYISCQLIKTYPQDILPEDQRNMVLIDLIRVILEQQKSCNEVLSMLKSIDQSPPVMQLVSDYSLLVSAYEKLDIESKISENQGSLILTDESLIEITDIATRIRSYIIE